MMGGDSRDSRVTATACIPYATFQAMGHNIIKARQCIICYCLQPYIHKNFISRLGNRFSKQSPFHIDR